MTENYEGPVDEHPAGRAIDAFRVGQAVVGDPGGGEAIHLIVTEFSHQGQMVDAIGLEPNLATELGEALLAAVNHLRGGLN